MRQSLILDNFRRGTTNVLFATSVAEEGLDVQHCSLVLCYDVPARPLSIVQTVGRARARHAKVLFMQAYDEASGQRDRVRHPDSSTWVTSLAALCSRSQNSVHAIA